METGPFEATAIDAYPSKSAWDASAAELVGTMLHRWHLTAGEAFVGGEAASVLRVTTQDGTAAVLKVGFPHEEAVWEAVALEAWGPALAPRVLRQDAWTWALLLEDVRPGIPLARAAMPARDALVVGAELYGRLGARAVPPGILLLEEAMAPFVARAAASAPADDELLRAGLAEFEVLLQLPGGDALLHGDYNPGNVLQSAEGWVAIDPKPVRGDPAFDLWPLVSQLGTVWSEPHPEAVLARQLDVVCSVAGVDRDRSARWGFARSALNISWFRADGDARAAGAAEREAAAWRAVAGLG